MGKDSTRLFPPHTKDMQESFVRKHVSLLLLEPYWRDVYCQLQTNELQKLVLNIIKIKHLYSHVCSVTERNGFHTAFLLLFLNSLCSVQHEKVILSHQTPITQFQILLKYSAKKHDLKFQKNVRWKHIFVFRFGFNMAKL